MIISNNKNKTLKIHPQSIKDLKKFKEIKPKAWVDVNIAKYNSKELFFHIFDNHILISVVGKKGVKSIKIPERKN